jgi:polyisoprenoid-binding protein YceI
MASDRRRRWTTRSGLGLLLALTAAGPLAAAPASLALDPGATRIRFDVDSTLHRIHGSARLETGEISFDSAGGPASGRIVIDARSLETGNGLRDGALHEDVLESERFPRMTFVPERVEVLRIEGREADVRILGRIDIHGSQHELAIPGRVSVDGERLTLTARFPVPYVAWGMQDPGNFLLSVDDVVNVEVEAVGRVSPPLP